MISTIHVHQDLRKDPLMKLILGFGVPLGVRLGGTCRPPQDFAAARRPYPMDSGFRGIRVSPTGLASK